MMLIAITGLMAGVVHVLSGPDHLAAVAPLAIAERRRGWLAGWTWGVGHASGVVVVAVLAVLLRDVVPDVFPAIDTISNWSERLVGGALIGVGLWALRRGVRLAPAPHGHGPQVHGHLHVQTGPGWLRRLGHAHASFYLGVLHGVAGSSHFFGVLPALALPTQGAALAYIAAFGVGTVTAMTAFATAVGYSGSRIPHAAALHRGMMFAASALAIIIGGYWLIG